MDKFASAIGVIFLGMTAIFFFPIIAVFFGALSGWIVGLFFEETILGILSQMGIKNVSMWQVGAFAGFFGGFLKTKVHQKD